MRPEPLADTNSDPVDVSLHFKRLHPWLEPWSIQISSKYFEILGRLCRDLESIYGPKPRYRFLRITEESVIKEVFQMQLVVFSETRSRSQAKNRAELQAINLAINESKQICRHCGSGLESREVIDDDLIATWPHVELMSKPPYDRCRYFCAHCLAVAWGHQNLKRSESTAEQQSIQEDSSLLDAEANTENQSVISSKKSPSVMLVNPEDLKRLEDDAKLSSRDTANRIKGLLGRLQKQPLEKRLVCIPEQWRQECESLEEDYPNFKDVISFLRTQMALSAVADDRALRIAPFLLVGGAGIGKTDFMLTLAGRLGSTLEIINISNSQTGCALTGAEQYWSNSQTGKLFNLLVTGEIANPLVCLDELDKARKDQSYDPLAALYQLLEPKQAARFTDLSMPDLPFDASHVLWIATANDRDAIPKPIADRFAVFQIAEPDCEQSRIIVRNQYRRFIETHPAGRFFKAEPLEEVVEALGRYHPRQVRKTLQQCFGMAAYHERTYLTPEDVRACGPKTSSETSRIGFLAEL